MDTESAPQSEEHNTGEKNTGADIGKKPDVRYYHLMRTALDQAVPQLVERSLENGWRVGILSSSLDILKRLDDAIWTHNPESFIPHALIKPDALDESVKDYPALLGMDESHLINQPHVLFILSDAPVNAPDSYKRICRFFDGNREDSLKAARVRWKEDKENSLSPSYFQEDSGGWRQVK